MSYEHDDLARLQSVNCSSNNYLVQGWQQTFSYDAFGNISKSGSLNFQPGQYSASTNQVSYAIEEHENRVSETDAQET